MPRTRQSALLADAADVLSDQLHHQLHDLAIKLAPRIDSVDRAFLRCHRLEKRAGAALLAATPGAAFRLLAKGAPIADFIEQVEYNGRRLAKLNIPPQTIITALEDYTYLLLASPDLVWLVQQLNFCVILTLNNAFYQVREAETQAFYDLFRVELESQGLEERLERFLITLSAFCGAQKARIFLLEEEGEAWVLRAETGDDSVVRTRKKRVPNSASLRKRISKPLMSTPLDTGWVNKSSTVWSVPLGTAPACGVMQFAFPREYSWLPRELELLTAAAERCWLSIERAKLVEGLAIREEQIRQLAEHMLQVEEVERRRISRELHDEAGQSLLCVRLQMEMLEAALPPELVAEKQQLREAREAVERTIIETRRLISALSPAVLEQLGLGAAVRQLANRFRQVQPIKVHLKLQPLDRLPKRMESVVYRLVQECFHNISKHSFAKNVNVSLGAADGVLKLVVVDDGIGFDTEEAFRKQESFGLTGMQERVALLGGSFFIESYRKGQKRAGRTASSLNKPGTKILVQLPIPLEDLDHDAPQSELLADARVKSLRGLLR